MTDRQLLKLAATELPPEQFVVWLQKHYQGHGRRAGARFLGITQEAWRYRLEQADHKMTIALENRKDTAA